MMRSRACVVGGSGGGSGGGVGCGGCGRGVLVVASATVTACARSRPNGGLKVSRFPPPFCFARSRWSRSLVIGRRVSRSPPVPLATATAATANPCWSPRPPQGLAFCWRGAVSQRMQCAVWARDARAVPAALASQGGREPARLRQMRYLQGAPPPPPLPTTTVTRNAAIGCGTLPLPCRPHLLWPAPAAALHTHFQEALRAWQQDGLGGRLEILLPQRRLRALHTASCALEVVVVLRSACPSPTLSHPRTLSHVVCVAGLIISKAVSRNPPPLTPLPCISAVASLGRLLAPSSPSLRSPPRPMVAPSVWCKANRPQSFVGIRSRGHGAFFGELSCTNRCDHV